MQLAGVPACVLTTSATPLAAPAAAAAYAGHTVLNLLFPWAFSKHDAALKNFTLPLTPEENAAAEEASRQAGLAVVASR